MSKNYELSDNELEKITGGRDSKDKNYYAFGTVVGDIGNKSFLVELENMKIVITSLDMNLILSKVSVKVGDMVKVYVEVNVSSNVGEIVEVC